MSLETEVGNLVTSTNTLTATVQSLLDSYGGVPVRVTTLETDYTALDSQVQGILADSMARIYPVSVSGGSSGTILATTHGCGTTPHLVAISDSGVEEYLPYTVNVSGDISWTSSPAFTGTLKVIGVTN
jgi:hypothetical protein